MQERKEEPNAFVKQVADQKYEFGFTTDVHTDIIDKGLNEDVVRLISQKKGEPDWLLDFRLKAFEYWKTLKQPTWSAANRLSGHFLLCRPAGQETRQQRDRS